MTIDTNAPPAAAAITGKCAAEMADPAVTAYFDGSCPLCRAEIDIYRRDAAANEVQFLDVSDEGTPLPAGLDRTDAMRRFHVRDADGTLQSGATAFATLWLALPRWRWLGWIVSRPGLNQLAEFGYRAFLPIRPILQRAVRHIVARRQMRSSPHHSAMNKATAPVTRLTDDRRTRSSKP